ncbi:MAG: nucleotidyltransferase domain-containing protein [Planctomycetota bacterium]
MRAPSEVIEAVKSALAREPHLRWAYVFGSVVRGSTYRDVDVAIMPASTMPAGGVAWGVIVARLEAAVAIKVDLVDLSQPNLPLIGPMLAERVVVVDREPAVRRSFEVETTSRWLDFRPSYEEFLRIRTLAMQKRLQGTL